MENQKSNHKELLIKINIEELTPTQVRLLKSVTSLLTNILAADEESEFFDMSAELMRKVAETIKHADFANSNRDMEYGEQAVEFAIDFLNESLENNRINNIDN
jgi:hypothetical protein